MAVLIVTIGVIATTLAEAEHKQHATKAPNNPVGCLNCNNNDLANTEAKAQVSNGTPNPLLSNKILTFSKMN
jgi:hypothetical protein